MIVSVTIDLTFTSRFPRDTFVVHRVVQSRSSGGAVDIGKTKTAAGHHGRSRLVGRQVGFNLAYRKRSLFSGY